MNLITDEQTIDDLWVFNKRSGNGIYDIYNRAGTRGGEALLEEIFRHPMSDKDAINKRSRIIEAFAKLKLSFPYSGSMFDMMEKYLAGKKEGANSGERTTSLSDKEVQNGVASVIELFKMTKQFIERTEIVSIDDYSGERKAIAALLADPAFEPALKMEHTGKLSFTAVAAFDVLFRERERSKIGQLLSYIFYLDVYIAVAATAIERGFVFPRALDKGTGQLKVKGLFHPSLKKPVSNDITMDPSQNVIFLTGANMAGKSTFLRSLSTALYLAHMGFPVAAQSMEFAVLDGIFTTVNLPDNLGIGASHFYAEVLRVKKIAQELSTGKSYFILFDELFRGTNVKDAHEATVAVTRGFATKRNSLFIISSHIVEAGEQLKLSNNIGFLYLPTLMNGKVPEYTFKLEPGITDDRHGMIIIRNEGILDTLANGKKIA